MSAAGIDLQMQLLSQKDPVPSRGGKTHGHLVYELWDIVDISHRNRIQRAQ